MSHPAAQPMPTSGLRNGAGTGAMVVAVTALVMSWSVVGGIVGGAVAIVLGIAGRGRARRGEADNGPVATAGAALGAVAIAVGIAAVGVWSGFLGDAGIGDYIECMEGAGADRPAQQQCENAFRDRIEDISGVGAARP